MFAGLSAAAGIVYVVRRWRQRALIAVAAAVLDVRAPCIGLVTLTALRPA
jgi:hypothetical protein